MNKWVAVKQWVMQASEAGMLAIPGIPEMAKAEAIAAWGNEYTALFC